MDRTINIVRDGTVCVAIVTYNSGRYIRRCLEAVLRQEGVPLEVVVVDNASTDDTRHVLRTFRRRIRTIFCDRNLGFAEAQNRAIKASTTEWVLTLNPDVLMRPGFLRSLVEAGAADPEAGCVCGKLFSIGPGFKPLDQLRIDSTGIYFTPNMRHFDRGWREPERSEYDRLEYVFGASAAAALYRRAMIDDVAVDGEFFDPDFFVYREDADVAWRAMLMGWRTLYTPAAVAYHVRTVTPANRRSVPSLLNMHSVKNRFLMRIKNATAGLYRRFWLPMTLRDLVVVAGALVWEPTSAAALWHVARCLPRALRRRRAIMSRRRISDQDLARWFQFHPAAMPANLHAPEMAAIPAVALRG
ncbi:MAG TPA: glycosyltransferase family 2 protein [Bryobacteraceae bacterium]|nr:glycosyltransferase family 2 protein [Bryobacteraceae bacterium]